eukprot:CAMPEP_0182547342 /NCGR_PEP_ID=MMETSP1323-20130603/37319_1 /TAXON_ID=236787 /ORGANISM="Florenciella parvula, Strain RCC1693" /LENGTH=170 /DNA_ID=CAMNT_0024758643 /DNA_START=30 /DNA_END=543 /DNA_ORIENTATION=+
MQRLFSVRHFRANVPSQTSALVASPSGSVALFLARLTLRQHRRPVLSTSQPPLLPPQPAWCLRRTVPRAQTPPSTRIGTRLYGHESAPPSIPLSLPLPHSRRTPRLTFDVRPTSGPRPRHRAGSAASGFASAPLDLARFIVGIDLHQGLRAWGEAGRDNLAVRARVRLAR